MFRVEDVGLQVPMKFGAAMTSVMEVTTIAGLMLTSRITFNHLQHPNSATSQL